LDRVFVSSHEENGHNAAPALIGPGAVVCSMHLPEAAGRVGEQKRGSNQFWIGYPYRENLSPKIDSIACVLRDRRMSDDVAGQPLAVCHSLAEPQPSTRGLTVVAKRSMRASVASSVSL
jgi:hypothetical protein